MAAKKAGKLAGQTFVVTGTIEGYERADVRKALEALGAGVSSGLSGKTTGVIVGADPGSKAAKGKKLGLKILNQAAFKRLVGGASTKKKATKKKAAKRKATKKATRKKSTRKKSTKKKTAGKKATKKSTKKAKAEGKAVACDVAPEGVCDDITIRFAFTKGDGGLPEASQFSKEERSDLRPCLELNIFWEPDEMDDNQDAKIRSFEILYDGVTRIEGEKFGYWFEEGELRGYPTPIIRFRLTRPVDAEEFRRTIFGSSVKVMTASMEKEGREPFFAEDHNGYTAVLSEAERDEYLEYLELNNAFCGKAFDFPGGLPECECSIPGTGFVLGRTRPDA